MLMVAPVVAHTPLLTAFSANVVVLRITVEIKRKKKNKTHLLTGYVHAAYPQVYTDLAKVSGFNY